MFIDKFHCPCYYKDKISEVYAVSTTCVDRTFLFLNRDSKRKIYDMPYHLDVRDFSGEAHLLIVRVQPNTTINRHHRISYT